MAKADVALPPARARQMMLVHELRNSLNVATVGFGVLLHLQDEKKQKWNPKLTLAIQHALINMAKLIDRAMLDAREVGESAARAERLSANELMEELAAYAELEAKVRGHSFVMDVCKEEAFINVDRTIISAALINLLSNAFKFTRPKSQVALTCTHHGKIIRFAVTDQCYGLNADVSPINQPPRFQQRHADKSGMGIGLSITNEHIEEQGGKLIVTDFPGKGCSFAIEFPRID